MASIYRDPPQQEVDRRALWERPLVRRLVTKDAENTGMMQDEGSKCNMDMNNGHSCKNP
jgi:hypothetical protein